MKVALFLAATLAALPVCGQESTARSLAATCAACHGTDGRTATKDVVAIAGLPKEHIASQMRAFRDGTRPATVMHQIAKGYSDQQIDLMADYFSRRPR